MNKRPHYLFVFLFCLAMLGMALFFQLVVGLEPCPLCIFQRIAIMFIGLIGLLAFLHNPQGIIDRIYGLLLVLGAAGSIGVAVRHVWLLSLPKDEAASCGPGLEITLDRFIEFLPQGQWTETLFRSGAECTEVSFSLFGLGLPQLTFPVIILFGLYLMWLFFKQNKQGSYW
ncbi:MAG: disulfide bond formation protein B [Gammaproteobacteria bacterium]|nr:disulfide bond formation protein B [Gammaproteobacteria bacterium]MBU1723433.1 disulfide bond formation protein B [Gammaproteobacteria bacterium]MBU2003774.1 disulfide bond formation protein B [Gammaproteobacteria bacterium]